MKNSFLTFLLIFFTGFAGAESLAKYVCKSGSGEAFSLVIENRNNDVPRETKYLKVANSKGEVIADVVVQESQGLIFGSFKSNDDQMISPGNFSTVVLDQNRNMMIVAGFFMKDEKIREGGGRGPRSYSCELPK